MYISEPVARHVKLKLHVTYSHIFLHYRKTYLRIILDVRADKYLKILVSYFYMYKSRYINMHILTFLSNILYYYIFIYTVHYVIILILHRSMHVIL